MCPIALKCSLESRAAFGQLCRQMTTVTDHCYLVTDHQIGGGEPIIKGTRTTVRAVVELWRMGRRPEQIPHSLPPLTLAQVFDALSYSSDQTGEREFRARSDGGAFKMRPRPIRPPMKH